MTGRALSRFTKLPAGVSKPPTKAKYKVLPIYRKQAEFRNMIRAGIKSVGFIGGRGTGKTTIGGQSVAVEAKKGEPWVCVSPDYGVAIETAFPVFIEITQKTGQYIRDVRSPFPRVVFRTLDGGRASLVFRSAEKPEKLRGGNYAGAWLDEPTVFQEMAYTLIRSTLRWKQKMGPVILTGTPKGTHHWTFGLFYFPVDQILDANGDLIAGLEVDPKEQLELQARIHAGAVESINGRLYVKRPRTGLIKASTQDNPFLPDDFYDNVRRDYGSMLALQELGGEFIELGGLLFRRDWFNLVDTIPRNATRIRYFDQAATPGSGCYTAGVLMARTDDGRYWVENVIRGQWGPLERNKIIDQIVASDAAKYGGQVLTYVEQEGGSAGKEVAAQMVGRLPGYSVFRDIVSGKKFRTVDSEQLPGEAKVIRAMPFAAAAEAGLVYVLRAPWTNDYLTELAAFPEWKFADQVDASSGGFNKLAEMAPQDPGTISTIGRTVQTGEKFGALAALNSTKSRMSYKEIFHHVQE
ncbi:MAG: phage terminase large subunit [Pirellulales bacterium]